MRCLEGVSQSHCLQLPSFGKAASPVLESPEQSRCFSAKSNPHQIPLVQ